MQETIRSVLNDISSWVWGPPLLVLLVGTGLYLTFLLRGLQFRRLGHALWLAFVKRRETGAAGDISHFQALMTALSATVGTGNIAGVATAIALGGPGALFWMWITGLVGMATKYSEALLGVHYREKDALGTMSGGPMYYLRKGLNSPLLGTLFALFTSIAAFGIGNMVQSNSVADALQHSFSIPVEITGIVLAIATALVILGGIRSIARVTEVLVPFMIVIYMVGALWVVALNISEIPAVIALVLQSAFSPTAAAGGFAGATVLLTIRMGVARGVFSNESGLGSAAIAAAAAQTRHPVTQALVSMTQTFIDTIIVCSLTGFVILVTGSWTTGETGAPLTAMAFQQALPGEWGDLIVTLGLVLFAYSTVLGWSYYGEKAFEYLLGEKVVKPYRFAFVIVVLVGAVTHLDIVWTFADIMNGLMAIPNLIGLIGLSGVIARLTHEYFVQQGNTR